MLRQRVAGVWISCAFLRLLLLADRGRKSSLPPFVTRAEHRVEPLHEASDTVAGEVVVDGGSLFAIEEDTGALQERKMSRHGRRIRTNVLGQLADAVSSFDRDHVDDVRPRWVSERFEYFRSFPCPRLVVFIHHYLSILPITRQPVKLDEPGVVL